LAKIILILQCTKALVSDVIKNAVYIQRRA